MCSHTWLWCVDCGCCFVGELYNCPKAFTLQRSGRRIRLLSGYLKFFLSAHYNHSPVQEGSGHFLTIDQLSTCLFQADVRLTRED